MLKIKFFSNQSGNMFTAILGVVAIVGVLSVSVYGLLSGPVKTAATVTAKSKAVNEMITAAQLLMGMASDTDGDTTKEAPAFKDPAALPAPTGGGHIPDAAGATKLDPWGTLYGYCVWDHGTLDNSGSENRLSGLATGFEAKLVIAMISAGPNKAFEVTCNDINSAADGGLDTSANLDDLFEEYSTNEAEAISGSVWTVVNSDEIKYDDRVGIGGDAEAGKQLKVTGDTKISGGFEVEGAFDATFGQNVNVTGSVSGASGTFPTLTAGSTVGAAVVGTVKLSPVDIDDGAMDNVVIGANTPAAGTFSTMTATNGNITTADIDGGTIDGTTINGSTITGTSIDGSVIGGSTPAIGTFTTLNANALNVTTTGAFNAITVSDTSMVANLTANYLGASPQDAAFFRNASNINAGTLGAAYLPAFTGDVSSAGGTASLTVTGLQGRAVSSSAPSTSEVLGWNGSAWQPMTIVGENGTGDIVINEDDPHVNEIGDAREWVGTCADGEIAKRSGGAWVCAIDAGGFANPATEDLDMNGYDILDVNSIQITSDFRYKREIKPMDPMLRRVTSIQPVTFFWNDYALTKGKYDHKKHLGLIAQDVEAMFPEAVITSQDGHKGIDYPALSAVMLQAIRELAEQNKALQYQIYDMKRQSAE